MDAATTVENWCTIASSKDCEPFQWHVSSHAGFCPILYVLSEVRSPVFQTAEWADLRRIIWLIERIRSQNPGLTEDNQTVDSTPGPRDNPMLLGSGLDSMGSMGVELDAADFLGFTNLGDFDFPDLAGFDPMSFSCPSQWS
jgi:hypothetical protein